MLTNRYQQARWSLEQNQNVPLEAGDTPTTLPDRRGRKQLIFHILGIISAVVVALCLIRVIYMILNYNLRWSGEEEFFDTSAIVVKSHREHDAQGVLLPVQEPPPKGITLGENQRLAYVTLLCDNSGLPNARVLAFALKRVKSAFPLIILVLPQVTEGLEDLITLGATIEKIPQVLTPFRRLNGKRPSFQKMCKYSKIHAWSLIRYAKLIYVDPSLLIVKVRYHWQHPWVTI